LLFFTLLLFVVILVALLLLVVVLVTLLLFVVFLVSSLVFADIDIVIVIVAVCLLLMYFEHTGPERLRYSHHIHTHTLFFRSGKKFETIWKSASGRFAARDNTAAEG
jgi:hypothetical protein